MSKLWDNEIEDLSDLRWKLEAEIDGLFGDIWDAGDADAAFALASRVRMWSESFAVMAENIECETNDVLVKDEPVPDEVPWVRRSI